MLVLSRRYNESVVIVAGGVVVARVVLVRPGNGRARIGFETPDGTLVYRAEICPPGLANANPGDPVSAADLSAMSGPVSLRRQGDPANGQEREDQDEGRFNR